MAATSLSRPRAGVGRRPVERYAALGDSFTAGAAGSDGSEGRFADDLARALAPLEYRNLGVPGASGAEVARGQIESAVSFRPDLLTLVCGANDVLLFARPDLDVYAATFAAMLDRLRAALPDALLLTATCPDFSPFLPFRPRSRARVERGLRELAALTRTLARERGVPCLDFAAHPHAGEWWMFAADGIHPSRAANRRSAAAFARAVGEALALPHDTRLAKEPTA